MHDTPFALHFTLLLLRRANLGIAAIRHDTTRCALPSSLHRSPSCAAHTSILHTVRTSTSHPHLHPHPQQQYHAHNHCHLHPTCHLHVPEISHHKCNTIEIPAPPRASTTITYAIALIHTRTTLSDLPSPISHLPSLISHHPSLISRLPSPISHLSPTQKPHPSSPSTSQSHASHRDHMGTAFRASKRISHHSAGSRSPRNSLCRRVPPWRGQDMSLQRIPVVDALDLTQVRQAIDAVCEVRRG